MSFQKPATPSVTNCLSTAPHHLRSRVPGWSARPKKRSNGRAKHESPTKSDADGSAATDAEVESPLVCSEGTQKVVDRSRVSAARMRVGLIPGRRLKDIPRSRAMPETMA
jgi:hypothetical protein